MQIFDIHENQNGQDVHIFVITKNDDKSYVINADVTVVDGNFVPNNVALADPLDVSGVELLNSLDDPSNIERVALLTPPPAITLGMDFEIDGARACLEVGARDWCDFIKHAIANTYKGIVTDVTLRGGRFILTFAQEIGSITNNLGDGSTCLVMPNTWSITERDL